MTFAQKSLRETFTNRINLRCPVLGWKEKGANTEILPSLGYSAIETADLIESSLARSCYHH